MFVSTTKTTHTTVTGATVTLSAEEAGYLLEVTHRVGGPPTGARGVFDRLRDKLTQAGVKRSHHFNTPDVHGSVTFEK